MLFSSTAKYSAYHQIITIKISKNRNNLEEFSSLVVDNDRKFPKNIAERNYLVACTVYTMCITHLLNKDPFTI